jgi:hypothetical protein
MTSKRVATSPAEKMAQDKKNKTKMSLEGSIIKFDVTAINGKTYYGVLSEIEIVYIWEKILGRSKSEIFGMTYNRSLTRNFRVTFKLNEFVLPRSLYPEATFSYRRAKPDATSEDDVDTLECKFVNYDAVEPVELGQLTRITVTTNGFMVEPKLILAWLAKFGSVSAIHAYEKNSVGIRTDVLETEIALREHVPEYLPVAGRKLQVAYPGIPKSCNHCYQSGHLKRACKNKKLDWIGKVREMRASGKFTDDMFGGWIAIIEREN